MTTQTRIILGDVVRFCKHHKVLGLPKFHALLCDAPYGLSFMGKDWDSIDGVAFDPETWRAIADTLLPGAYLFVFAGNLNDDLISVAMRRAGLVKQHKSLAWANGSSLPKTTRIDDQVDAAAGKTDEREVVGRDKRGPMSKTAYGVWGTEFDITAPATPLARVWAGHKYGAQNLRNLIEAILIFRKPWEGKAYESIVRHGAGALNIAGSRIAASRNDVNYREGDGSRTGGDGRMFSKSIGGEERGPWKEGGRHPANFYITHVTLPVYRLDDTHPLGVTAYIRGYFDGYDRVADLRTTRGVDDAQADADTLEVIAQDIPQPWLEYFIQTKEDLGCVRVGMKRVRGDNNPRKPTKRADTKEWRFDNHIRHGHADADGLEVVSDFDCARDESGRFVCPVALLDEQAGERGKTGGNIRYSDIPLERNVYGTRTLLPEFTRDNDTGGPSRFVVTPDWSHEQHYADATEQRIEDANAVRYQAKPSRRERDAGLDGFEAQYNDFQRETSMLSRAHGDKDGSKGTRSDPARNFHPTVKSISLIKYLAGLLLPPDAYAPRRLFVPFAGSGSEMIGGLLAGWEEVVGVELEADYVAIARARNTWWENESSYGQSDPAAILKTSHQPAPSKAGDVQLSMFDTKKTS